MKEYYVTESRAEKKDGSEIIVNYSILSEELVSEGGQTVGECFGVKLKNNLGEQAAARMLTFSLGKIDELIEVLSSNMVLPMELDLILEDYFGG